ncbi:two component transcriptional regulator, AraC family [Paenibacillus curdlanolyticus YK9]|uniref:Two component transcriptional regulator, AraC family n=1 Tax=Paenibacillus curdlanolyticus YK9 TaxID=717606 RepID=E0IBH5_9BACL|nr:response regulator [Paenibacillus curdlanolyticus]EFM10055.1 two component transcriptional regulator, AraC family [Paenibacillus curdlanolyticus YK9]
MFNVLVVDDEIMVCKGISMILGQSGLQLGEIFIAKNGFEALDLIRLEPIDLVITDIQMEKMNGIELMETIFLEDPSIPVIVLSAHGEFEYAQKAMKFGAREYIVKPVKPDHLIGTVSRALQERETKIRSIGEAELNRKFNLQDVAAGHNMILQQLAFEGMAEAEALELLGSLGFRELESGFTMMVIKPDLKKGGRTETLITSLKDRNLFRYACRNVVEETIHDWKPIVFYLPTGSLAAVLQLTEKDAAYEAEGSRAATIAQKVHNNLEAYLHVESIIGISGVGLGLESWPALYGDAQRALEWHSLHPDHYVFYAGDFGEHASQPTESATVDSNNEAAQQEQGSTIQAVSAEQGATSVTAQAKAFIDANYQTKGLKLQDIASAVHLSPNYLCYLFKKDMKMNMWDYVTQCRMEEGKRLLRTTDKRRYEIADEIGYETPEHFSKIFKRYYGISLSEFKK